MNTRRTLLYLVAILMAVSVAMVSQAQTERATLSGRVVDDTGGVIVGARVDITNIATNVGVTGHTNREGIFVFTNMLPGQYRVKVEKEGFQSLLRPDVVLHVQDDIALNFTMKIGSVVETLTVTGEAPLVNNETATVSTVVDRNFVENLPLNGRSFQSLLLLTPGVVFTSVNSGSLGQFSVNGQRADSNYVTVDGVSANFGMSTSYFMAESLGGAVPATNVLGGYNSLVSVDALQEFRIQTSTYAPEFGRQPGGQVSIVTRSGSSAFHGTAFNYLRNDIFDANDYFNRICTAGGCTTGRKPALRQNDFGGVLGGPIVKEKAFFFFSYEGLRLRKPNVLTTARVPSLAVRAAAPPSQKPLLDMFPLPTPGGHAYSDGSADYFATWSDPGTVDAYSGRVDVNLRKNLTLFGRYNYSPSQLDARGGGSSGTSGLSEIDSNRMKIQTATAGLTWLISPASSNDFRVNYSRDKTDQINVLDTFGGAVVPPDSYFFNGLATLQTGVWAECIVAGCDPIHHEFFQPGHWNNSLNQAYNLVDNFSHVKGTHMLKFGADLRRNSMFFWPFKYFIEPYWTDINQILTGNITYGAQTRVSIGSSVHDMNYSFYGQDTWKVTPRLTLTYGLRWDIETPMLRNGGLPQVTASGLDQSDPTKVNFALTNGNPYPLRLGNFAPRVGISFAIRNAHGRELVVRGGYGRFYNLVSQTAGMLVYGWAAYPVSAGHFGPTTCCPFPTSFAAPDAIVWDPNVGGSMYYPGLQSSYVHEYNVALEQSLGQNQVVTLTYVGAQGRHLAQSDYVTGIGPTKSGGGYIWGLPNGYSYYHALQAQFRRNMSRGLQILASYNWSHSIDNGSVNSFGSGSDWGTFGIYTPGFNRGPSLFDIRHTFSTALTYNLPTPNLNRFTRAVFGGWALDNIVAVRTAPPSDIGANIYNYVVAGTTSSLFVRPDRVPGVPLYLTGPQYPGGKAVNLAAFTPPPSTSTTTFFPARQGNFERNGVRNFPASQWDIAVRRQFNVTERVKLQWRMEAFNVLNHPNFGYFGGSNSSSQALSITYAMQNGVPFIRTAGPIGVASILARSLNGVYGGVNPLYSIGGPRSMQTALKLTF